MAIADPIDRLRQLPAEHRRCRRGRGRIHRDRFVDASEDRSIAVFHAKRNRAGIDASNSPAIWCAPKPSSRWPVNTMGVAAGFPARNPWLRVRIHRGADACCQVNLSAALAMLTERFRAMQGQATSREGNMNIRLFNSASDDPARRHRSAAGAAPPDRLARRPISRWEKGATTGRASVRRCGSSPTRCRRADFGRGPGGDDHRREASRPRQQHSLNISSASDALMGSSACTRSAYPACF